MHEYHGTTSLFMVLDYQNMSSKQDEKRDGIEIKPLNIHIMYIDHEFRSKNSKETKINKERS